MKKKHLRSNMLYCFSALTIILIALSSHFLYANTISELRDLTASPEIENNEDFPLTEKSNYAVRNSSSSKSKPIAKQTSSDKEQPTATKQPPPAQQEQEQQAETQQQPSSPQETQTTTEQQTSSAPTSTQEQEQPETKQPSSQETQPATVQQAPSTPIPTQEQKQQPKQKSSKKSAKKKQQAPKVPLPQPQQKPVTNLNVQPKSEEDNKNGYIVNFNNVSIIQFIRFIANISKTNFIYKEAELKFNVTVYSKEPTSLNNITGSLLQILRLHGFDITEQGNNALIYQSAKRPQVGNMSTVISKELQNDQKRDTAMETRVFRVYNVDPSKIVPTFQAMLSANALIEASTETSHLIVSDIGANVNKIEQLLQSLDKPNISLKIDHYKVQKAFIETLINLTEKILQPFVGEKSLSMIPYPASNTIFIVSTPYLIKQAKTILASLDISEEEAHYKEKLSQNEIDPETKQEVMNKVLEEPSFEEVGTIQKIGNSNFFHYALQYMQGDVIATALQNVATSLVGESGKVAGENEEITYNALAQTINSLQWMKNTNSLLFLGDTASLSKVMALLKTLDTKPKQVFIEVLVIKTTLKDGFKFGVEWTAETASKRSGGYFSGTSPPTAEKFPLTGSGIGNDAVNATPGKGLNLVTIGRTIRKGNDRFLTIGALINAVKTDVNSKILMTPKIITQNNFKASIFSGTEYPFVTTLSTSTSDNLDVNTASTSIEYKNIGTSLEVTPIINAASDIITLDITQKVESAEEAAFTISDITPIQTDRTTTQTRVNVPNKHFLVLGGQIKQTNKKTENRVPCLGGLPVIGAPFKNSEIDDNKEQIMIFLRPEVVNTPEEAIALSNKEKESAEKGVPRSAFAKEDMANILDALNMTCFSDESSDDDEDEEEEEEDEDKRITWFGRLFNRNKNK